MQRLDWFEKKARRADIPQFKAGDQIRVHVKVKEGDKERVQVFEGHVIKIHRRGIGSTFTVRKVSYGVGVERIFPYHSPVIAQIEMMQEGKVNRAKLYYIRKLSGRKARINALEKEHLGRTGAVIEGDEIDDTEGEKVQPTTRSKAEGAAHPNP